MERREDESELQENSIALQHQKEKHEGTHSSSAMTKQRRALGADVALSGGGLSYCHTAA